MKTILKKSSNRVVSSVLTLALVLSILGMNFATVQAASVRRSRNADQISKVLGVSEKDVLDAQANNTIDQIIESSLNENQNLTVDLENFLRQELEAKGKSQAEIDKIIKKIHERSSRVALRMQASANVLGITLEQLKALKKEGDLGAFILTKFQSLREYNKAVKTELKR